LEKASRPEPVLESVLVGADPIWGVRREQEVNAERQTYVRNYSVGSADSRVARISPGVALQQRLGLLSQQRDWNAAGDRHHSDSAGSALGDDHFEDAA
jgi:hypothetical protein